MNGASESLIQILTPANYEYWCKADTWTLQRGVLLLLGVENFPQNKRVLDIPSMTVFFDIVNIAKSSLEAGDLLPYNSNHREPLNNKIPSSVFIAWARLKGYEIPPQLESISIKTQAEQATNTQTDDDNFSENERTKYLRIIGLLAETLANTKKSQLRNPDGSISIGNGEIGKTGKTNLTNELLDTLKNSSELHGKGLGKTVLQNTIKAGIKALRDNL